jgi:AcrR family transcriptional regulator
MPHRDAARARLKERRLAGSREEILKATREVLAEVGVPRLTLEAVARRLGVTKQALYHYFSSKDELLFEVVIAELTRCAEAIRAACLEAKDGPAALEALIRAYVGHFAGRLDTFRLMTHHVQLAEAERLTDAQLARLRPLNDVMYAVAEDKLGAGRRRPRHPRRLAFVAHLAAMGLLTMKATVERFDDPLRYGDDELVDELCRVFRTAAAKGATP